MYRHAQRSIAAATAVLIITFATARAQVAPPVGAGAAAATPSVVHSGRGTERGVLIGIGAAAVLGSAAIVIDFLRRPTPEVVSDPDELRPDRPLFGRPSRTPTRRLGQKSNPPNTSRQLRSRTAQPISPRPGFAVPGSKEGRFVADEVLVSVRTNVSATQMRRFERRFALTFVAATPLTLLDREVRNYRIRPGTSVAETVRALRRSPQFVAAVQPNFIFELQDDPQKLPSGSSPPPSADPVADATRAPSEGEARRAMPDQYAFAAMNIAAAHRIAKGKNVLIAIIDTGLDETRPDIASAVTSRFDAVGGPFVAHPHGTAMAGVIVAHDGLLGIAPDARVIAVRAFSTLPGGGVNGTTYNILRGLDFAVLHGAQIINMSFAGPQDALLGQALDAALRRGVTEIAAAGNEGPNSPPLYPAAYEGVIAVTATDAENHLFAKANRGPYVALAAPGVNILAPGVGGGVQLSTGTSVASAEASGVAALIIESKGSVRPNELRKILTETARRLPASSRAGLIDADAAVRLAR